MKAFEGATQFVKPEDAYALPPTATYDISLVVAGASAQRNRFQQEFSAICQASTLNLYQASPTATRTSVRTAAR